MNELPNTYLDNQDRLGFKPQAMNQRLINQAYETENLRLKPDQSGYIEQAWRFIAGRCRR